MKSSRIPKFAIVIAILVLIAAFYPGVRAGDKELAKLEGTWSYVWFIGPDGQKMPEDQLKKMSITYAGDKWTVKEGDRVLVAGTQKLNPAKTPLEIDSLITEGESKGVTMLGIYEFSGDTFKVCFDPSGKERPKSLTPKEGQFGGVIKKQKK